VNKSIQLNKSDLERTFFDKKALEKAEKEAGKHLLKV